MFHLSPNVDRALPSPPLGPITLLPCTCPKALLGYSGIVLVSACCCNKLPQTYWLKPTQIYFLRVLEVRSLERRCWQGCVPSGDFRANLFPRLFQLQDHLQPSTIFIVRCYNLWFRPHVSLSCLCPACLPLKNPCDYSEPTR